MILDDGLCMLNDTWEWLMRLEDGEERLILVDGKFDLPTEAASETFNAVEGSGEKSPAFLLEIPAEPRHFKAIQSTHQHQPAKPLEPTSQPQGLSHGTAASIQRQFRQLQRCFVAAAAVTVVEATFTLARRRGSNQPAGS